MRIRDFNTFCIQGNHGGMEGTEKSTRAFSVRGSVSSVALWLVFWASKQPLSTEELEKIRDAAH